MVMRRLVLPAMIGFGAGLTVAGILAIVSPFTEPITNVGILCLGVGLGAGGVVTAVMSRGQGPG
jgi:hypothetical protein